MRIGALGALAGATRMLPAVSLPGTVALAGLALLQPALGFAFMLAVGRFVGQLPDVVAGVREAWVSDLVLVAAVYLAQQLSGVGTGIVEWRLGRRLEHALDDRVMADLLAPPELAHVEDVRVRDLTAEVADGFGAGRWKPSRLPIALRVLTSGVVGLVLAFGVVTWLEWWLGLLLAGAASWALYTVVRHSLMMILGLVRTSGEAEFRRLEYERDAAVSPASAKEVRLFGFAPWMLDRWQARLERVLALDLRKIARLDAGLVCSVLTFVVVVGGGFAWVALQAGRGELGLAAAAVLAQALLAPLVQFGPGGQAVIDLALTARPLGALRELEDRLAHVREPTVPGLPIPPDAPRSAICLHEVRFGYPGADTDVLRGVDLQIPAGSSLGVVGLNGAGKTTLVKLLCRFYEPTAGRLTFDGMDARQLDRVAWQRRVAAIFQDFARYPLTARANIAAGDLSAAQGRIAAAATRAGVDDLLAELPDGWDTPLSREFDGGVDLSGGQWQRIALGRALLAAEAGAGLLILDEPAAHLDVRAEAELNERFLELRSGLTTVVISHRFSTVRRADRICVLEDGRVVEIGSHDELLAAEGRYARMFRLQAERFAV